MSKFIEVVGKADGATGLFNKLRVDANGNMNITDESTHTKKTFTEGTDPSEPLGSGATADKQFVIVGGVDNSNTNFSEINPIRTDSSGNIYVKEVGTVNIAPANSVNAELTPTQSFNVKNSKITQGYDTTIASGGAGLQQILIYGRDNGGDLRALESNGDRLMVDVQELSPTGPHTPTSLPSVAIHGQVNATSGFKNLRVTTDGRLQTIKSGIEKNNVVYSSQSISGSSDWATTLSAVGYSKVKISVSSDAVTAIAVSGSDSSSGTYVPFGTILPITTDVGASNANIGEITIEPAPDYIKLTNADAGGIVVDVLFVASP
jgi:hypothetical protein